VQLGRSNILWLRSVVDCKRDCFKPNGIMEEKPGSSIDRNTGDNCEEESVKVTQNQNEESVSQNMVCPICLQTCVHPVELPCSHIFCFLCIKGVFIQDHSTRRCAICRQSIPNDVLRNPRLKDVSQLYSDSDSTDYHWFYEARSGGWWKYDERTMQDLEKAFESSQSKSQLLIVGQLYEIDFDEMIQYRVNNRNLFRRIKRDVASAESRGVAGLRLT